MKTNTLRKVQPQHIHIPSLNINLLENNFYLVNTAGSNTSIWFQGKPATDHSVLNDVRYIPMGEFTTLVHTGQVLFLGMRGACVDIWIPMPSDTEIADRLAGCNECIQEHPSDIQPRLLKKLWLDIQCLKDDELLFG